MSILASVSSHNVTHLEIRTQPISPDRLTLRSTLAQLEAFKEIDAVLANPQFLKLRRLDLVYKLVIYHPVIPGAAATQVGQSLPTIVASIFAQLPIGNDAAHDEYIPADPKHPFVHYAKSVIESNIRDQLKQFQARAELNVQCDVWVQWKIPKGMTIPMTDLSIPFRASIRKLFGGSG